MITLGDFTNWILFAGAFMAVNGLFISIQNKRLSDEIIELKRKGRVLVGNQKGFLALNQVIVLLAVNHRNVICAASRIDHLGPFQLLHKAEMPLCGQELHAVTDTNCEMDFATWKAYQCAIQNEKRGGFV